MANFEPLLQEALRDFHFDKAVALCEQIQEAESNGTEITDWEDQLWLKLTDLIEEHKYKMESWGNYG